MTSLNEDNLEIGKTYAVDASDCCVSTTFTLELVEIKYNEYDAYDPDDEDFPRSVNKLIFAHGVVVAWPFHGTEFTEVEPS